MSEENPVLMDTLPFCRRAHDDESGRSNVAVLLRDGDGGFTTGYCTPEEARSLTAGLRSVASEIDGREFFDGGWNTAEALRYAAADLEELSEQYRMQSRSIENAQFEHTRMRDSDSTKGDD